MLQAVTPGEDGCADTGPETGGGQGGQDAGRPETGATTVSKVVFILLSKCQYAVHGRFRHAGTYKKKKKRISFSQILVARRGEAAI